MTNSKTSLAAYHEQQSLLWRLARQRRKTMSIADIRRGIVNKVIEITACDDTGSVVLRRQYEVTAADSVYDDYPTALLRLRDTLTNDAVSTLLSFVYIEEIIRGGCICDTVSARIINDNENE